MGPPEAEIVNVEPAPASTKDTFDPATSRREFGRVADSLAMVANVAVAGAPPPPPLLGMFPMYWVFPEWALGSLTASPCGAHHGERVGDFQLEVTGDLFAGERRGNLGRIEKRIDDRCREPHYLREGKSVQRPWVPY